MKRKVALSLLIVGLLSACTPPDYSKLDNVEAPDLDEDIYENQSTSILTFNGLVLGITEDNKLIVEVADPEEAQLNGLTVNPQGVAYLTLAAVDVPEGSHEQIHQYLTNVATDEAISFDIPIDEIATSEAYISLLSEKTPQLLQKNLLDEGFVYLEKKEEYQAYLENVYTETTDEIKKHIEELKSAVIERGKQ